MMLKRCLQRMYRRVIFIPIVALGFIFLLHMLHTETNFKDLTKNFIQKHIPPLPSCPNILDAMKNGTWKRKLQLTIKDIEERHAMDIFLRKHRGQPINLTRGDLRCGKTYPIPAPEFGPDIPATCNHDSESHCCNSRGLCSSGHANCACAQCTDFRKILHAELYNWTPLNCQIRNYSSDEACAMVSNRLTSLVVVGDSLMRHFYAALMLIFTGDFQYGALIEDHHKAAHCTGERQFVDRGKAMCHGIIARSSEAKKHKFCKGKSKFSLLLNESYALAYRKQTFAIVKEHLNRPNSLILLGIGLHDGLNADRIESQLVDPILEMIGSRRWPRLLWVTIHAQGFLKPPAYSAGQSNHEISQFNRLMASKLKEKEVEVFDVYPMTKGVYSYDGTHYGYGMNIVKAQYLLNYIHQSIKPINP